MNKIHSEPVEVAVFDARDVRPWRPIELSPDRFGDLPHPSTFWPMFPERCPCFSWGKGDDDDR